MSISGAQVRAARALLGWTARDLAREAIVNVSTVTLIERASRLSSVGAPKVKSIQDTLEAAGIEFLNGDAPGVRLHPNAPKRTR